MECPNTGSMFEGGLWWQLERSRGVTTGLCPFPAPQPLLDPAKHHTALGHIEPSTTPCNIYFPPNKIFPISLETNPNFSKPHIPARTPKLPHSAPEDPQIPSQNHKWPQEPDKLISVPPGIPKNPSQPPKALSRRGWGTGTSTAQSRSDNSAVIWRH